MKNKTLFQASCLLAAAVILTTGCKKQQGAGQQQAQAPELAVITVGEEDATLETAFPATLHGKNDVEIRPQVSGFLTSVDVREGQKVSKGQTLFTIDKVQLQAAVDQAQAAVVQAKAGVTAAEANVSMAQTQANNNKPLYEKGIIAQSAYQTSLDNLNAAQAQLGQAKAGLVQANAALTAARKNLSYANVTAPTAGIVGTIDLKEGSLVSPSSLLTVLSNNSDIEAYFSLTEKEVLQITDGGQKSLQQALQSMPQVYLQLANGTRYPEPGKIVSISGVLDTKTGSAKAIALFPNPDGMLHSGNTGQVMIPSLTPNAMLVPQKATFEVQDMKFVFVVGDSSKVHSTPIQVSPLNDGQNYIVTEGLKPGDKIVVEGVGISVQDGMTIKEK